MCAVRVALTVPIKVFANFRKVRALTRDISAIAAALSDSTILQLHPDGKHVKRIVPVPEYNIEEIQKRTVVVEGLPVGSTIGKTQPEDSKPSA